LPRPGPSAWPALAAFLAAFVLLQIVTVPGVMGAAVASSSVFALVAAAGAWLTERSFVAPLRLGRSRATPGGVAAAAAGTLGLSVALGEGADLLGLGNGGKMGQIASALAQLSPAQVLLAVGSLAVLPAIAEEAFFRGLLQTRLVASWGRWPGVAATAAAFGLVHFDPVQGTVAFAAGLFLGWVAERLGGIRPTVAAHFANNALSVALVRFVGDATSRAAQSLQLVAGCAAFAGALAFLCSRRARREPATRNEMRD
jgi:membrane protease YdiL (CAAX protease family)